MNKYLKEFLLWALIALPYFYLATIWNQLPEQVPIHFNLKGVANNWSSKTVLLIIPGALGLGIYLLMLAIPALDPKKKIQQMGGKYYSIRFILTLFTSIIAGSLLYAVKTESLNPILVFALLGGLFAILGNYFQTVRPNYFIGIRTPWTLQNEQVWKKTHHLGGLLFTAGGILIIILAFAITKQIFFILFILILSIMVIVPIVFSYTEFQKEKNMINK
jgi:uncharacterized membrane protein